MDGYDLYNGTPPHQWHSDTSRAAAQSVQSKALVVRARVLDFIRARGAQGATDDEVHIALKIDKNTTAPRRRELQLKGQVTDSGFRRVTTSGKFATVWVVSDLPGFVPGPYVPVQKRLREALQRIANLEQENATLRGRLVAVGKES